MDNKSFSKPNQYITLWKYLIYTTIAKQMIHNEAIDYEIRSMLETVYSNDPERSLSRSIKRWVGMKINFSVLSTGLGYESTCENCDNRTPWIDRVEILEALLQDYIDDSTYLIVFDELDEDYKDVLTAESHKEYIALLTSLFKAVQDVKSLFPANGFKILPVVFLRDDIYEIVSDPDKNKWNDFLINITWSEEQIKSLLAYRISKAISRDGDILSFPKAWETMFDHRDIAYGHGQHKRMGKFPFMVRSSMLRPRDFIKFMKDCSSQALEQSIPKITSKIVQKSDDSFSNYLRNELEDEIHSIIPDIARIFDLISHIRKQTIPVDEFRFAFNEANDQGLIKEKNVDFVLRILFHFSVIGNQPKQRNYQIYRYKMPEARFNTSEPLIVHRGLYKALQII
ncbi:P-loop ATPase, Sll1717 family [Pseudodesulfovibrio indicus]|uniref:P-loop ATPase, Sll1717 family n=1 Tax=Pseudodesulfovibrio indicus TaxID=1716143 RepID=UPI00130DE21E|nr:hypothetical protein [Pseudodesulfovibrio indicus]